MKYKQTNQELLSHYQEQLDFLRTSVELFDQGKYHEAKRIALQLRILLHDNGRNSKSLMKQLGYKDRIKYLDLAPNVDPKNVLSHLGLTSFQFSNTETEAKIEYIPKLQTDKIKKFNFRIWWEKIVISDQQTNVFSRKDLVLSIAEMDGGAHIDDKLQREYAAISRFNSLGIVYSIDENRQISVSFGIKKGPFPKNMSHDERFIPLQKIVENSIRTIAYEFLESIKVLKE